MERSPLRQELEDRAGRRERSLSKLRDSIVNEIAREAAEDLPTPRDRARSLPVATIRAGIRWLAYPQDEDAIVSQFGIRREVGCYSITLCPHSVLVVEVEDDFLRRPGRGRPINPMTVEEVKEIERRVKFATYDTVAVLASGIKDMWNGPGCTSVSFRLNAKAEFGVEHAYKNYSIHRHGCKRVTVPKGWC